MKFGENLFNLRIYDADSILKYYYVYWEDASRFLDRKKEKMEEIYNYIQNIASYIRNNIVKPREPILVGCVLNVQQYQEMNTNQYANREG